MQYAVRLAKTHAALLRDGLKGSLAAIVTARAIFDALGWPYEHIYATDQKAYWFCAASLRPMGDFKWQADWMESHGGSMTFKIQVGVCDVQPVKADDPAGSPQGASDASESCPVDGRPP